MENRITIKSADDTDLPVYVYEPNGIRSGSLVLIQEIFGVNDHIKSVAKKFSDEGYIVWVPELYHRLGDNIQLGYKGNTVEEAKKLKAQCGWELPVMDIMSCVGSLKISHSVSLIGFCYGGSLAWKSACVGYGLNCSISFYGSQITDFLNLNTRCPTLVHLGEKDMSINEESQKEIIDYSKSSTQPVKVYKYKNADHGFFCNERESYHKKSAELAFNRSINFLKKFQ
ncbi:MAG: Carboxymethylenebutenolidase [Alphaproteobacteria bacterium MarineAlpha9_Bin2]|nr:MAG: Carboxymethylenebutenolidase [Alphaproteobacteria bacterium MarineAlpha9_Bin1]PPR30655.1 MAG: Carboxymethylenebutenolidase [Alphaproteobacteria bacterium MarineAlpha9_Bin2]